MIGNSPYSIDRFRPVALTIAGYDPSGGAGVLADVKTFEFSGVYGLAVITCNTHQNDIEFHGVTWIERKKKEKNLKLLAARFPVKAIKLGMHEDLDDILHSVKLCKKFYPDAPIIWDSVFCPTGGEHLGIKIEKKMVNKILPLLYLITPNQDEACELGASKSAKAAAIALSAHCAVLLKGGHSKNKNFSEDSLFVNKKLKKSFSFPRIKKAEKHGSGCVLSAAITASLAKDESLEKAIHAGKKYVTAFLKSNTTLSGYHLY